MTTLRRSNPRFADQLGKDAGWALRGSGPSQKALTSALGVEPSQISRRCNGTRPGPTQRFFELVARLTCHAKTHAGHLIAGAMAVMEDVSVKLDPAEIRRRLIDALEHETDSQAEEDRAEMRLMLALGGDAGAEADALETWIGHAMDELGWQLEAIALARARQVQLGRRAGR